MNDAAGVISDDLVRAINARLLVQTPLRPADLLLVFGTREGVDEFVEAIVELWRDGYCRHILISGGATWNNPDTEAAVLRRALLRDGVPDTSILIEPRATNTGENVIFSLPIIDAQIDRNNIGSVIALGKVCTSVRYLMTLQRHWPEVEKMLATVNPFATPVERWHTDPAFRERVVLEWRKIEPYRARGFIADWP
jgi:uncharacterized SAM-binding protein YcdF (DUF218 family)